MDLLSQSTFINRNSPPYNLYDNHEAQMQNLHEKSMELLFRSKKNKNERIHTDPHEYIEYKYVYHEIGCCVMFVF